MINFLKYKKKYFTFSLILVGLSLLSLGVFGLNLGIDFRGGSVLEVKLVEESSIDNVRRLLETEEIKEKVSEMTVQKIGNEKGVFLIRIGEKDNISATEQKNSIISSLAEIGEVEERGFASISGVVGEEIKNIIIIVALLSILFIISYIAFAFRGVSKPLSSWYYGIASFIALFHDILIILGVLALLGYLYGLTITIPIVTGLLVVWGYSINDTVVVFDRIRENLFKEKNKNIEKKYKEIVNKSLNETMGRSINTSLTTLLAIIVIFFVGGIALRYLILTLIIGIILGTYSSMFLASPLLVVWLNKKLKVKNINID